MLRRAFSSAVNQFYEPAPPRVIPKAKSINSVPLLSRDEVLLRDEERDLSSADAVRETVRKNAMFTWGPSSPYSGTKGASRHGSALISRKTPSGGAREGETARLRGLDHAPPSSSSPSSSRFPTDGALSTLSPPPPPPRRCDCR